MQQTEEDEETRAYRLKIEKQKAMREKILRDKEMRRRKAAEDIKSKDEVVLRRLKIYEIVLTNFNLILFRGTGEEIGGRDSPEIETDHCHREENYFAKKKIGGRGAIDEANQIASDRSENSDGNCSA